MRDFNRDFTRAFVFAVLFGGVCIVLGEYGKVLVAENLAKAAVETVVPPQLDHKQLEIEIPLPAPAPVEVTEPAVEADFTKITRERRVLAYSAGLLCEALSNATYPSTPGAAFSKQFLKQFGCQIQVAVLDDAGLIARDPALSFAQGFLIGL